MPFQEGNNLGETSGGGRKGYEFEREQLKRMSTLLDKYLGLLEKAIENTDDEKVIKKLQLLGGDMRKILDKLHATKEYKEYGGEIKLPVTVIIQKDDGTNSQTVS